MFNWEHSLRQFDAVFNGLTHGYESLCSRLGINESELNLK